jgi:hypothetical protein
MHVYKKQYKHLFFPFSVPLKYGEDLRNKQRKNRAFLQIKKKNRPDRYFGAEIEGKTGRMVSLT